MQKINKLIKLFVYKTRMLEILYRLFFIFPIKNNKIVCSNFEGKSYGESPKYIVEKLLESKCKLDIVWVCNNNNNNNIPRDNVRTVKINTLKYFYELATSRIWVFNTRKKMYIKKRKKQFYIQTWHGSIALKKIEMDAADKLDEIYLMHAKEDSKDIDLFLSSNTNFSNQIKKTFQYLGEIIEKGTPKNDVFKNQLIVKEQKQSIHNQLKIEADVKILFYAPTFRDNYSINPYDIDIEKVLDTLEEKTNERWVAFVKFHPKLKDNEKIKYFSNRIYVKEIETFDISSLIMASDFIVTDYSSVMFDGMICRKKVVLYIKDYKEYYNERGVYFSFDELPFEKAISNLEFLNIISNINFDDFKLKYEIFEKKIGLNETGKSSEVIAKRIIKIIEGKQNG